MLLSGVSWFYGYYFLDPLPVAEPPPASSTTTTTTISADDDGDDAVVGSDTLTFSEVFCCRPSRVDYEHHDDGGGSDYKIVAGNDPDHVRKAHDAETSATLDEPLLSFIR